jgi:hypothetical protein
VHLIQEIGSYAGFAAVVGLAVLSALYFSQARDVKRLRDWAGRAPERASEAEAGGRPQTVAARATEQRRPAAAPAAGASTPQAKPTAAPGVGAASAAGKAPAAANAAGAAPAAAVAAAKPAQAAAPATAKPATAQGAAAPATASPAKPAAAQGAAAAAGPRTAPAAKPATAAGGNSSGGAKVLPPRPSAQASPRATHSLPRKGGGQTAVMTAPLGPERRWMSPRNLALIVAALLLVGTGGALGVIALTSNKTKSTSNGGAASAPTVRASRPAKHHRKKSQSLGVNPAGITVAVLNGTNVSGLAASTGQKIRTAGFQLGNVTNASQQQRAESVVMYTAGQSKAARAVGRKLGISQIEPVDAQTAALAGSATVVVVVGVDKSHG